MSHWNYRVIATKIEDSGKLGKNDMCYAIHEVHYDDNDIPVGYTENPVYPITFDSEMEDPIESIKWQLDAMKLALEKPVLDDNKFPNEYLKYSRQKKLKEIEKYIQ